MPATDPPTTITFFGLPLAGATKPLSNCSETSQQFQCGILPNSVFPKPGSALLLIEHPDWLKSSRDWNRVWVSITESKGSANLGAI
jgi:hypothetical protein